METTHAGSPAVQGDGAQGNGGIITKARERATAQLTEQKNRAVEGIDSVTQAVRQSTQQLRDQQHETLAQYVERAANQVDRLAQQLRNKDVGDLFEDAQRLARRQPAVFIGSAFVLGLIGARFLKSSSRRDDEDDEGSYEWHGSTAQPSTPSGGSTDYRTSAVTERTSAGEFGVPLGSTDVSETGVTTASGTPSSRAASSSGSSASSTTGGSPTSRSRKSGESGRR